jgi:hypothetical protein
MNNKHQVQVPDMIWEWAQKKYGMQVPATPLREIWMAAMLADAKPEHPPETQKINITNPNQSDFSSRWRALGLAPDPMDIFYEDARNWMISTYECEEDAINAAERKQRQGGYDVGGTVGDMRALTCYYYKEHLKRKQSIA